MNKRELIQRMSEKSDLSLTAVNSVINAFEETVQEELKKGNRIQLVGFGTFETYERSQREGRNPQTKEKMVIKRAVIPKFKAGKSLRDALN